MKAVVIREFGGPERLSLEEIATPEVLPGHVLIRVRACGVNRVLDVVVREGKSGFPGVRLPLISGAEPAGEVVDVGAGVNSVRPGDRVVCVPWISCGECDPCLDGKENLCQSHQLLGVHRNGGYAEYVLVPERSIVPIPDEVDFVQAAAAPVVFSAAWHLLVTRGRVGPDDTVLVLGASGGLGIAAIQIAKLMGARVLAAAGSDHKAKLAESIGADVGINYTGGFAQAALEATDGKGPTVVFESVGAPTWNDTLACVAHQGRILTCGATGGNRVELDFRAFYRKHLTLISSSNGTRAEAKVYFGHMARGALKPVIYRTFPLEEAGKAQELLMNREHFGKIVLTT